MRSKRRLLGFAERGDTEITVLREGIPDTEQTYLGSPGDYAPGSIWSHDAVFAATDDGVWLGTGDDYEVEFVDWTGATTRRIRWEGPDLTVTQDDIDRHRENLQERYRRRGDPDWRARGSMKTPQPTRFLRPASTLAALVASAAISADACGAQVLVENSLSSAWTTTTEWKLEEDLRIWGPPEGYLSLVVGLAADSRDNIYILDYVTQEIYVFDSEGAFVRTLGGQGDGPGEFRDALGPAIGPKDTLWVADQRAPRFSVFSPDGTFLGVQRRGIARGGRGTERCTMTSDSKYLEWWTRFPKEERTGNMSDIDLLHFYPLRLSTHAEKQDTLPYLEFTQQMADMPSVGMRRPVRFGPELELAFDCRGGIWFAVGDDYRLYRRSLDGDTTIVATLDGPRAADIDESDRDEVRAPFGRRPNPAMMGDYLRSLPAKKPIISHISLDGAGHVFVFPETSRVEEGTAIDVFREDGVFVGRLAVPGEVNLTVLTKTKVYSAPGYFLFAGEDDAGTPYVSRVRIRR